jgi:hypothetical protein
MSHRRLIGWALLVVAAVVVTGCSGSTATKSATDGWTASKDPTGSCQVATPPDWQLGRDFHLERQSGAAVSSDAPGYLPAASDLWPSPQTAGNHYQLRTSLEHGDMICSVWRVKESVDFTADEKAVMDQVGETLQVVAR